MIKKIFKSAASLVWFIVSCVLIVIFTAVTIVATGVEDIYGLLNLVMPGGGIRAVYAEGIDPIYTTEYKNKKEVYAAARDFNREICEDGYVLLKNKNDALPIKTPVSDESVATKPKISVFGKNSVNIAYGGSGSGGANTANVIDLYKALDESGYEYNPTLKSFYDDTSASGELRKGNSKNLDSGDTVILSTAETPQSRYTDAVKSSYSQYKDAALVVFTRIGGEGFDLPRQMVGATGYRNEDDHFLQLDANEEDMLAEVCKAGFEKVIVIINSGSAMELGFISETSPYVTEKGYKIDPAKIDGAIWMGYPGETGTLALGNILNGKVNPSGRLVDTYATDFKADPTFNNFGDNLLTAMGSGSNRTPGGDEYVFDVPASAQPGVPYYFVDYEEGVYVGYRYYETRGVTDGDEWYNDNVVYPFGYGLSYTKFDWTVGDKSQIENKAIAKDADYAVEITVKNTGGVAGKEVVQLYGHAPYEAGGIEKPEVVLVDYAKTKLLQPGESETLTLSFDPYYLASYDYRDMNKNGSKCYELDASDDYALYVNRSAHDNAFKIPFKVASDIIYDKDTVSGKSDVKNRYTDCDDSAFDSDTGLETVLSRADWEGTFPKAPTAEERRVGADLLKQLQDVSHNNTTNFKDVEMPWTENLNGLTLRDLLYDEEGNYLDEDGDGVPFADYDDIRWETLLDQCSVAEMTKVYDYGSYHIESMESIGLPRVSCADGPVGWACFMDQAKFYDTCSYCAQAVVAATFSKDIAHRFGVMIGDEGLIGYERGDRSPYTNWYAPGVNIHRSPFGGRNFEYYSEDSLLSGMQAAYQIQGCQSKGVYCMFKHFAVNEQETHRSISGDSSWLTEQSLREIYLRPFEIGVKVGKSRGLMTSFNRIGTRWTGGDYRLCTEILRNEWGFRGSVICDFNTIPAYMNSRQMAYAGGDINLATLPVSWCDSSSAADVYVLRGCVKNICYSVVNSNAMNGEVIGYKMPIWQILLIVFDCVLVVGLAVWGFFAIRKVLKKTKTK